MSTPEQHANPLFAHGTPPRFEEVTPAHVHEAMPVLLEALQKDLEAFEASVEPTWDGTFERVRILMEPIEYAWKVTSHLMSVRNSDELRAAYEAFQPAIIEIYTAIGQSQPLYDALEAVAQGPDWEALGPVRQRLVQKELTNMRLSGLALQGEAKDRFNAIQKELADLSTQFSNAVLDSRKAYGLTLTDEADIAGFPQSLRAASAAAARAAGETDASAENGPWRITLTTPLAHPFLRHCRNGALREEVYRANATLASSGEYDNRARIDRILTLRKERAELLGFTSHAETSLCTKMAEKVSAVESFMEEIRSATKPIAEKEHIELQEFARKASGDPGLYLNQWDVAFWSERMREQQYDLSEEELKPYHPFPKVLEGLFAMARRLFEIDVVAADGEVQVWHPDVRYFRIRNLEGETIASFYLDPYSRPENKRGGAWMNAMRGRQPGPNGETQHPIALLVCNQSPPTKDAPSLMTRREVVTLFHEFGHGLQHMLTTVDVPQAAGISNVEWDAVELPSQFMENWTLDKSTVAVFARHYETDEPMPDELFDRIIAAKNFRSASGMMRQIYLGHLDMALHHYYAPEANRDLANLKRQVIEASTVVPPLDEDRQECSFGHIFAGGYSAGYYSYKWAEVLSADAFSAFEEAGLDDEDAIAELGRRFRDTVLSQGGGRHPMDVFQDFRGRAPSPDALMRHHGLT